MSKFVNYKKRSVTLPRGCKNLIDALRPHEQQSLQRIIERVQRATVTRDESVAGMLSEVGKYVAMVFESRGLMFTLWISTSDERLTVDVTRMEGDIVWASVTAQEDTDQQKAVRAFFARRGLHVPDDTTMPAPPFFHPDLPVHVIFQILPLPSEPSLLSKLLVDLFHDSCGLKDDAELRFHYDEMSDAG